MLNANWLVRFGGLATEPAAIDQWHLRNTGQFGGTPGIDINVVPVWPDYTGRGVKIGIIDDGFDLTHPDLAANFKGGWDSVDGDATPAAGPNDWHGTAVAGVLGADDNGTGLLGVAHDADLYGFRISFDLVANALPALLDALGRQAAMDVSNNSWGFVVPFDDNFTQPEAAPVAQALMGAAQAGRGGLGTVWVFAAGNERAYGDSVNHHNIQNSRYVITVGAVDASGHFDADSTPGAALLVSAPGTSVLTTDVVGAGGYDLGDTVVETGTSLAAPMVSGVVALMLEANAGLGFRDVQAILAASARPIDTADPGWTTNGASSWNGGGYRFSNDYGFGLVDAKAAVRLAETWMATGNAASVVNNTLLAAEPWSGTLAIPDGDPLGVTSTLATFSSSVVERVEVHLSIQHSWIGDLVVTLTSPSGTTSTLLLHPGIGLDGLFYGIDPTAISFTVASNAFRGERSAGNWTLRVTDDEPFDSGVLTGWHLQFVGRADYDSDTYIYTDAFATLPEASRRTLADEAGTDTINAAAVTSASTINLETRTATIAGTALTIAAGTLIEHAIGGDGADALTGNAAANTLWGGRGHDTLLGRNGDDTLDGGAGDDRLDGGAGLDAASYSDALSRVVVNLALTGAQNTLGAGLDTLVSIESLIGSRFNDVLTGNAGTNAIAAGAGLDLVHGSAGSDTLRGGAGTDTIDYRQLGVPITILSLAVANKGALGSDFLDEFENATGTQFGDRLEGNQHNNVLSGLGGDDVLEGGLGIDRLDGGEGIDLASYASAFGGVTVYLNASSSTGSAGVDYFVSIEGFIGSAHNDTLVGNTGANLLRGGDGDDRLFGLGGDDFLRGGQGYDLFYGSTGTDTADYADATVTVRAVLGTGGTVDTINFGRDWYFDIENLAGGAAKDFLTGDANANRIDGNGGDDVIAGAGGADTLLGGLGNDQLTGGLGADIMDLGQGFDIVRYGAAAESRAGALDRIVNFTQSGGDGFDRIGFENASGALFAGVAPTAIALGARIELASAASLAEVMAGIIGLAASGPATLALAQVKVAVGSAAGSYLVVNDQVAAFDAATDMLVAIDMTASANLSAGNFFLF
jgi:subtilisin-like proprotein convertase family protein/Ca2+-binding RTX toxin-like protein